MILEETFGKEGFVQQLQVSDYFSFWQPHFVARSQHR